MLGDFAQKKETFSHFKQQSFLKSKKSHFFKGLTHAFGQKMPFFSKFEFDQTKPRNNAFYLCTGKRNLF